MSFDLADYVDVPERLRLFYERHPQGTMQGEGKFVRDEQGRIVGYVYRASAYRSPEDTRPGIGTAFEPVPGKTPYTRDSEVQNAETSAWGRAIVACGFETKKIASTEEVRNRQTSNGNPAEQAQAAAYRSPADDGSPANVILTFGKYKNSTVGQVAPDYLRWLLENFEPKTAEQRRILAAADAFLGAPVPADQVPFG